MSTIESLDIPSSHGLLEGLLRIDVDYQPHLPAVAAVVCHPHPQQGGTLNNKVVFTIAKALNEAGIPALRFNFRGVGRSTGTYDGGVGEGDDVASALDWMSLRYPHTALLVAGFSFGSWIGLPAGCGDPRVTHLLGVGVPVRLLGMNSLNDCTDSLLVIQGTQDEFGPLPEVQQWYDQLTTPRKQLHLVQGATHFFPNQLDEVAQAIRSWLKAPQNS